MVRDVGLRMVSRGKVGVRKEDVWCDVGRWMISTGRGSQKRE